MKTVKIEIKCHSYLGLLDRLSQLQQDVELFADILKENGMILGDTNQSGQSYKLETDSLEEVS